VVATSRRKLKHLARPEFRLVSATPPGQETSAKRPWLAALLAFLVPGLGHLYLRKWFRALLWFTTVLLVGQLLVPAGAMSQELSLEAFSQNIEAIPQQAILALLTVTGLSMVDAYLIARRDRRTAARAEATTTCPNCGKELDEDLTFCHWCTTELDPTAESEESEESADGLISR
jgi:hypothetical protein